MDQNATSLALVVFGLGVGDSPARGLEKGLW